VLTRPRPRAATSQHLDEEYGGPFYISVPVKMKVEDLRNVIRVRPAAPQRGQSNVNAHPGCSQDACGVMPGLQRLSYAGKNFEDSNRSLEQCVPPPQSRQSHSDAMPLPLRSGRLARR
jgi:hypothetical protein